MDVVYIVTHICVTLVALGAVALRVEHRLTKIETDVTWLKETLEKNCTGDLKDEGDRKVDPS